MVSWREKIIRRPLTRKGAWAVFYFCQFLAVQPIDLAVPEMNNENRR